MQSESLACSNNFEHSCAAKIKGLTGLKSNILSVLHSGQPKITF